MFVFNPDGSISMTYFNILGYVHSSQVAEWGNIYAKLEAMFNNYGVCHAVDLG